MADQAEVVVLTERRKLDIAYMIAMLYAVDMTLRQVKAKAGQVRQNVDLSNPKYGFRPGLNSSENIPYFFGVLMENAVSWMFHKRWYGFHYDNFAHEDYHRTVAYIVLTYYAASADKKIFELRREVPKMCSRLKELGFAVQRQELIAFTSALYADAVSFAFTDRPKKQVKAKSS